jgi:hypothetical protein
MPCRRSLQDGIPYLLPRIARAALATGRELLAKSQQYNSNANVDVVCAVLRGRQLREADGAQRPFVTNGLSDAIDELSQLHRATSPSALTLGTFLRHGFVRKTSTPRSSASFRSTPVMARQQTYSIGINRRNP